MKATEAKLLEFLKKSSQFIIPIYQRTYSWTDWECGQLWDDIVRAGESDSTNAHFVGSIVYVEKGLYQVTSGAPLLVIDGQQRLTTVTLLLEAIARAVGDDEPVEGFSAKKIRNYYLLNDLESGEKRFKLLLSQNDKSTLLALLDQKAFPPEFSIRIKENFELFEKWLLEYPKHLPLLCKGLGKIIVVDISLNRDQDNPQLIFESMNSTGLALSQADLIRNFVLMAQEPNEQTRLYQDYWRPMEERFGQEAYEWAFDGFMRHYLTLKTGRIPKIDGVYREFKTYLATQETGIEPLLASIHGHAGYYAAMALDQEEDPDLAAAFSDLRELQVDVAYPLLLELYSAYSQTTLTKSDFLAALRTIEAYVLRRAVCGVPTNMLNKVFAAFPQNLDSANYLESMKAHIVSLTSRSRFPDNAEYEHGLKTNYLYGTRALKFLLRRIENRGRKEPVSVAAFTIEHILPQNENLSPEWQAELGPEWQRIRETWLHTLGNLTLTGYNSEYKDHPFAVKCSIPGGFAESPLRLNQGLAQLAAWNEKAILERADRLASESLSIWSMPQPSPAFVKNAAAQVAVAEDEELEDNDQ